MDALMVVAGVVSALAALGALRYARDTVRETRALRHEERLARIPELITEVADMARRVRDHHSAPWELRIRQARLRAAIVASGEALPHSTVLTELDGVNPFDTDELVKQVDAAMKELTERLTTPG